VSRGADSVVRGVDSVVRGVDSDVVTICQVQSLVMVLPALQILQSSNVTALGILQVCPLFTEQ